MTLIAPDAAQLLRRAVQIAGSRPVTVADLGRAREEPAADILPPTQLRADAEVAAVVRRAGELSAQRGGDTIDLADLIGALVEAEAVAAGLDLDRLRFTRWRLGSVYATSPAARVHRLQTTVAAGEDPS